MSWNIREHEAVEKLNRALEDGIERIQATAEDFEVRLRHDMRDIAGKTRDALKRGRERTSEVSDHLVSSAREHPAVTVVAVVGLLAVIGGLILATRRR